MTAAIEPKQSENRTRFVAWVQTHPLAGYVLLAYAISWVWWIGGSSAAESR